MTKHADIGTPSQPATGPSDDVALLDGPTQRPAAVGATGPDDLASFADFHGGISEVVNATDGTQLHVLRWGPPAGEARAALIYLHGIASHGAWFAESGALLAARGIAVYAPDRRGSGRSDGPRGHLESVEQALSDVDRVMDIVAEREPGRPIMLAGSSWAAKLALAYAVAHGDRLAGLLLLAPGLIPSVSLPPLQRLRVLVTQRRRPLTTLPIPLTPEMYTGSVAHQEQIRRDPLRLLDATARFYWETNRLDRQRNRLAAQLRVPTLLLIGERDAMANVPATRRWFSRIGTPDRIIKVYAQAAHTLDFQDVAEAYRADLIGWIEARLAAHPSATPAQMGGPRPPEREAVPSEASDGSAPAHQAIVGAATEPEGGHDAG